MKMYALSLTSIIVRHKTIGKFKNYIYGVEVNFDYYLRNRYMSISKSILHTGLLFIA